MGLNMTAQDFREKHARNLKNSVEDIRRGVMAVTESPTAKAAKKADKMLQNLTSSITSGKWARGLEKVSKEDWQDAMVNKGVNRIAQGIDGAASKVEEFAGQLLDYEKTLLTKIEKMPDLTIEDSINRMTSWVRGMKDFKKR